MRWFILILMILLFVTAACKKEGRSKPDCATLKGAVMTDDIAKTGTQINAFIHSLPSDTSTAENLNNLAKLLSAQCGITATVSCFNCIKTLPAQSEMRLSFFAADTTVSRTIDLSYTPQNEMVFVYLHE